MVASSSFGTSLRRVVASEVRRGRVVRRFWRWVEEATREAFERAERAWMERRLEWVDWARDSGSVDVREARGRVVSRVS